MDEPAPDPVRALEVADQMLHTEFREEFTTALVALVDPMHQTLSCALAGHPGPLVWDGTGDVTAPLAERGLPLGLPHSPHSSPTDCLNGIGTSAMHGRVSRPQLLAKMFAKRCTRPPRSELASSIARVMKTTSLF